MRFYESIFIGNVTRIFTSISFINYSLFDFTLGSIDNYECSGMHARLSI